MRNQRRPEPGLHLHHGNRLEGLADLLAGRLRASSGDPLAAQVILVPHPGMAQWLKMRLADVLGIAANLHFPLPAVWLGQRAAAGLSQADVLAWGRDALAWRLFDLHGEGFGPLSAAAGGDDRQLLTRWQLAGQIAHGFERYLLQRPDWLRAWREGRSARTGVDAEAWQMRVWRHLFASAGASRQQALRQRLDPGSVPVESAPAELFAFGFASLPRLLLDDLQALAAHLPVHLFFPNPCRWYWGDLLAEREQLAHGRRLQYKPGFDAQAQGHPLLAGLGAVGRDFLHQLYEGIDAASETDAFAAAGGATALARLQDGLLELEASPFEWPDGDRSLRLVVAPNPRRELEALHDILLALLDDARLDLRAHQIVVMVPKLSDYAPMIGAVFGAQPEARRIPWQVTDLGETDRHPLAALFVRLLDLPVWRFRLGEVLDALARPAFAAAFDIEPAELPRLSDLLGDAGARWGLDGDTGARAQVGGSADFTFRFAIDRLIAGWLSGEDVDYAEGIAPFAALRGSDADLVGRFAACLETLDGWRVRLAAPRTLDEWARVLSALCAGCLRECGEEDEDAALLRLIASIERWRQRNVVAESAGVTAPRRVVRESFGASLRSTAVSALPGEGVNFCAMVPLRGLPFRVVALLGLGAGDFPRLDRDWPDDLCRLRPRPGDRSLSAEDRYLFLEALMSARESLILSRVDQDADTGLPREASPVLAEFTDFLRVNAFGGDGDALARRIERVALSPADPRHFAAGAGQGYVASHAGEWLASAREQPPRSPLSDELPVRWEEFRRFFVDPARTQLRWREVDLAEAGEVPDDAEPFELDGLMAYKARAWLLDDMLGVGQATPGAERFERLRGAGMLPPGRAGTRAFGDVREQATAIAQRYRAALGNELPQRIGGRLPLTEIEGEVNINGVCAAGLVCATAGRVDGKRRIGAWLDLLALSLMRGESGLTATLVGHGEDAVVLRAPAQSQQVLRTLLDIWQRARRQPLPVYPKSSAAYAESWCRNADPEKAQKAARATWFGDGGGRHAGERDDPACAELARCFAQFDEAPFAALALDIFGPVYGAAGP